MLRAFFRARETFKKMVNRTDLRPDGNKNQATSSNFNKSRNKWILALYFSSIGAFCAGLTGLIINGLTLINFIARTKEISRIGTLLIVAAFPLAYLGAHALDQIEKIDKARKLEILKTKKNQNSFANQS